MEELMENVAAVEDFTKKDRRRAMRRRHSVAKALRKQSISRHVYGFDWYHNLHEYSKNKVHCSCPLCRFYGPAMQDLKRTEEMDYDSSTYEEDTIDLEMQDELLSDELRQLPLNYDFNEEWEKEAV